MKQRLQFFIQGNPPEAVIKMDPNSPVLPKLIETVQAHGKRREKVDADGFAKLLAQWKKENPAE